MAGISSVGTGALKELTDLPKGGDASGSVAEKSIGNLARAVPDVLGKLAKFAVSDSPEGVGLQVGMAVASKFADKFKASRSEGSSGASQAGAASPSSQADDANANATNSQVSSINQTAADTTAITQAQANAALVAAENQTIKSDASAIKEASQPIQ
jgi:hypothetical protein